MQRGFYKGVPVLLNDAQDMFIYGGEEPFVKIGDAKGLLSNWKEIYAAPLSSFRASLESRSRSKKI